MRLGEAVEEKTVVHELGMPITVALVGCGKKKRTTKCKARDMYVGSLFRLAFEYAERTADDVHIISALHGLLPPFEEIESYQLSINQMLFHQKAAWAEGIVGDLLALYPMTRLDLIFYAGNAYIRPILEAAANHERYWDMQMPLEGMDLFERLRWFRENVAT
jgi:hypothetical protein